MCVLGHGQGGGLHSIICIIVLALAVECSRLWKIVLQFGSFWTVDSCFCAAAAVKAQRHVFLLEVHCSVSEHFLISLQYVVCCIC